MRLILVLAALLVLPATASAATVEMRLTQAVSGDKDNPDWDTYGVTVTDTVGEVNDLVVESRPRAVLVSDAATPPVAGPGCAPAGVDAVLCAPVTRAPSLSFDAQVLGGPGDDRILLRIPGSVDGGPGADRLDATSSATVTYADRTVGVHVTAGQGEGDDGEPGEGDTVGPGFTNVIGGAGDDELRLADGPATHGLHGGPGDDHLLGTTGRDSLYGEDGDDDLEAGPGDDGLDGGLGADRLRGGAGYATAIGVHVTLDGGPGDDVLDATDFGDWGFPATRLGHDVVIGGPGRDAVGSASGLDDLLMRDGERDTIDCLEGEPGFDGHLVVDPADATRFCVPTGLLPDRAMPVSADGVVRLTVLCSVPGGRIPCRGRVATGTPPLRTSTPYVIAAGERGLVSLRLPPAMRARLRHGRLVTPFIDVSTTRPGRPDRNVWGTTVHLRRR